MVAAIAASRSVTVVPTSLARRSAVSSAARGIESDLFPLVIVYVVTVGAFRQTSDSFVE